MSFIVKGGYDAFYRNIINVTLKKTNLWNTGLVMVNGIKFKINSSRDNLIEIIKYDDTNTLMVNNGIIYDNRKLFMYDIELIYNINSPDFSKHNFYNYINFNMVNNYNEDHSIFFQRLLN